jgi:hypothetical protein
MPADRCGGFGYGKDPLFLLCLTIYLINRFVIKPNLHHYSPFFHGHLDDSLTVPVALPLFLLVYRWIGFRPDDEPPRWWEIALHLAVWIEFFKGPGPAIFHHGTADPIDSWCMAAGALVSWLVWRWRDLFCRRIKSDVAS